MTGRFLSGYQISLHFSLVIEILFQTFEQQILRKTVGLIQLKNN